MQAEDGARIEDAAEDAAEGSRMTMEPERACSPPPGSRFPANVIRVEMIQNNRKICWTRACALSFTVGWWKESVAVIGQSNEVVFGEARANQAMFNQNTASAVVCRVTRSSDVASERTRLHG
jgi:hypothetical protein